MTNLEIENAIEEITKNNDIIAMQQMLDRGVDINFKKGLWLYKSAYYKQNDMVMQLLEKGASVSVDGYKAYKMIIKNGDLSMFKLFLTHGAPIDMGNYYPLEWAIKMEHLDIVNYLFQHEDVDIDKDLATCFLGNYQRQSFRNMIWDHFNTLERDSYTTIITSAMCDDDLKILKMVEENMPIQKLLNTFMQDNYNPNC